MNWVEIVLAVVFVVASAMAGSIALIRRAELICRDEARFGLVKGNATLIGAMIGGLAGLCAGVLLVFYTFSTERPTSWIEWAGRGSYLLIIGAFAGHLNLLVHSWLRVLDEEEAMKGSTGDSKPQQPTLTVLRLSEFRQLLGAGYAESDFRTRDDEVVDRLISVIGDRVIDGQRALSRLPFYGYLGTVCGILLMANELTRLDEATESFQVLRDMASGLVLAFQTTLAALLAYLPLRKAFDVLLTHISQVERAWLVMRDEE